MSSEHTHTHTVAPMIIQMTAADNVSHHHHHLWPTLLVCPPMPKQHCFQLMPCVSEAVAKAAVSITTTYLTDVCVALASKSPLRIIRRLHTQFEDDCFAQLVEASDRAALWAADCALALVCTGAAAVDASPVSLSRVCPTLHIFSANQNWGGSECGRELCSISQCKKYFWKKVWHFKVWHWV